MDLDRIYTTARITTRATSAELLALARERALDPAIFDTYPPFAWQSEISSNRLDAYFTVMDPATTLLNYARDAAAGVAVLVGHDTRSLPIGQSLTGAVEALADGVTRVVSDAYALDAPDSAPVLNRLKAGIVRDVSVGFTGRRAGAGCICSICGLDMFRSWDCWHVPGLVYEVKDTSGPTTVVREVLCTGLIVNASLAEYSLVYDGATPGAAVLQAQRAAEAGRLRPEQVRLLESRYRINLPGRRVAVPGATLPKEGRMDDEQEQPAGTPAGMPAGEVRATFTAEPADLVRMRDALERAGALAEGRLIPEGVEWLAAEVARLRPLAADGAQYRQDLEAEATREAVRALGAQAAEANAPVITAAPTALLRQLIASWRAIGDATLPRGRQTTEGEREASAPARTTVLDKLPGLSRAR